MATPTPSLETTVEALRTRLRTTAERLSEQARPAAGAQAAFLDVIQDIGNDIVNVAEEAVNTAAELAEAMVAAAEEAEAAALVEAMVAAAAEAAEVTVDVAAVTVVALALSSEQVSADEAGAGGADARAGASAQELIEARRRAVQKSVDQARERTAGVRQRLQRLVADFRRTRGSA